MLQQQLGHSLGGCIKNGKPTVLVPGADFLFSLRLQVQLNIRTFASSGLIYYVAHQNQMDYAVLQLHEGRLHFMFDLGKSRTKVSHPTLLSDGKWHTVSAWEAVSCTKSSPSTSCTFHFLEGKPCILTPHWPYV